MLHQRRTKRDRRLHRRWFPSSTRSKPSRENSATASFGVQPGAPFSWPVWEIPHPERWNFTTSTPNRLPSRSTTVPTRFFGIPMVVPLPRASPSPSREDTSSLPWTMDTFCGVSRENNCTNSRSKPFTNSSGDPAPSSCPRRKSKRFERISKSTKNSSKRPTRNVPEHCIWRKPKASDWNENESVILLPTSRICERNNDPSTSKCWMVTTAKMSRTTWFAKLPLRRFCPRRRRL
mmetsp:Transcript_14247/g.29472  ORF Transcript_14247/g.29472 Transcript_14247/m.29472 type:complete len:234 (-) Transcript_14247:300-1001(-)